MSTRTRKSKSIVADMFTLAGAVMLATALPADAVQNYVATPLGSLGGTYWGVPSSQASAINASGHVTGGASIPATIDDSRHFHAFIYANGVMIDLGTLGGQISSGSAINASGQVTGGSDTGLTDLAGTVRHAFLYSNGKMTDLGSLGGTESFGSGINSIGQVVGWSYLHGYVTRRAFLYSGGSMTDLGTLGGSSSEATGINDSGQVTGSAYVRDVASPGRPIVHAFLYSAGVMRDLGTLGGADSYANGINNAGEVTGLSRLQSSTEAHAFLYSGGRMIDLGTLGGQISVGSAINNSGQVTGQSDTTNNVDTHAFLYTDGKIYDLNHLVTNDLGPGVVLRYAHGINDRGQIAAVGCTRVVVIESACQAYRLDPITTAIEYHHEVFDHYFVTANPNEIASLDERAIPGWVRTGQSFRVFGMDPGAVSVCRFWSHQTFAPKSSHFYTPLDWECAIVKRNPDWLYEGTVFSMKLPDMAGNCVSGTIALYRVYNDGKSGAPNHRYTTSVDIRRQMIAQGWIPEGPGPGVIGCVPAP